MPRRPLQRVLVANRGEIARRVIGAARHAGLESVAVFAPDDRHAPHVGEADVAVALEGSGLAGTYLSVDALIAAAHHAGADALHPGYGFLSENPALAEACAEAGITWIGPSPEAMRVMGHKARAKEAVAAAGVAILPSVTLDHGLTGADLLRAARTVGFPLLAKASAGGGGRGMRLIETEDALEGAVDAARREAAAAFGSDEVFLERYLRAPRHIEVQVVGDSFGHVLHLYDRECSVQRRHQKLIEEAPAVLVDDDTRARMWRDATAAAATVAYEGVGTVEFLVDGTESFFLEMNTRLQVEHGVTELVTGLDLVGLQFIVAAGEPLPLTQDDVRLAGHAMEARLCAERPREDYRPTPGTVTHLRWPDEAGLRVDAAIEEGSTVSAAYDSLVAKVMAHAADRTAARTALAAALRCMELDGLETNRQLLATIVQDPPFAAGEAGVDYLDSRPDLRQAGLGEAGRLRHAAAAGFALLEARARHSLVPGPWPGWRNVGTAGHVDELTDADGTLLVRVPTLDGPAEIAAATTAATAASSDVGTACTSAGTADVADGVVDLTSEGLRRRYRVRIATHTVDVNGPEGQSSFTRRGTDDPDEQAGTAGECRATLPGSIAKILVAAGDAVADGDGLLVLEAMKMEHTLRSGGAGTVSAVHCAVGQQVDVGDLLVTVEPA